MLKSVFIASLTIFLLAAGIAAQNKFEGYNIVVDVPKTQTRATCAVRYLPPSTTVTITDLNPATPMKVSSCGTSGGSIVQKTATSATVKASAGDNKWCFQGEDKFYRITLPGDQYSGPVTYNWVAQADERTRGFYNIKDFGAVGDGQTDDTVAFKSAMAVIASNNGGTLTIPDGEYIITSPVAVPSAIIIQGTNGLHSMASTSDLIRRNPSRITLRGSKTSLFRVGECIEHVSFRDIELYAQSNDDTNAVEAYGAYISSQGFNFDRVTFQNFNRGINAYGLPQTDLSWQIDYVKVNACRFVYNRDTGIFVNSRNTDWKIQGSLFINPKKQPGQNANSMHFERVGAVLIEDTFGGGFVNAFGGTFINILDSAVTTIIGSQTEQMTASIVYNGVENPYAGDYSYPITIINSIFDAPIIFKARRTLVSTGSFYGPKTFSADERVRVYSTGDRFCYDGNILGCQGATKNNFDRATVIFMTGQPSEGQVKGHPTYFGTDVQFGAPVQMPALPVNTLPTGKPNGSMVYCSDCRRSSTPCQGGGNGAPAMVVGNQWSCL
ncbi:MAG: hypothetical protein KA746_05000 [Pyrinomonadaceae bacterium]|nr:hypothetical protein [Pyrinomonadaceae bacterium]MBP6213106.1 hypothetical protein [Pyrinomonadaceae bacterium]